MLFHCLIDKLHTSVYAESAVKRQLSATVTLLSCLLLFTVDNIPPQAPNDNLDNGDAAADHQQQEAQQLIGELIKKLACFSNVHAKLGKFKMVDGCHFAISILGIYLYLSHINETANANVKKNCSLPKIYISK